MIIIASYSNVSVTYTADGTQTVFSFPFDYLRKAFVYVEVNEETILTQGTDYSVSGKTVVFATAPASGTVLRIYRSTDTTPLVSWADASVLRAKDMTLQQIQDLHILEEQDYWTRYNAMLRDGDTWDARGFQIKNMADPTDPTDAVNKEYLEAEAIVKNPDDTYWVGQGLPIKNIGEPTDNSDVATKQYADNNFMRLDDNGTTWVGRGLPVRNIATPGQTKDATTKEYVDNLINTLSVAADRYVVFDTVAAMKAADLPAGYNTRTLGYHEINDGGAGTYSIRGMVAGETEDDGSIIFLENGNVAELITDGTVNVNQFGAIVDEDSTVAIQKCLDYCRGEKVKAIAVGNYYVSSTIKILCEVDFSQSTIKADGSVVSPVVQVGENDTGVYAQRFLLPTVENIENRGGTWGHGTGILILRATSCEFSVPDVLYFEKGLHLSGGTAGCQTNIFHIRQLSTNKINLLLQPTTITGWANQNTFIGGRLGNYGAVNYDFTGSRLLALLLYDMDTPAGGAPNNNAFYNLDIEGGNFEYSMEICGNANMFNNCRYEGSNAKKILLNAPSGVYVQSNIWIGGYQSNQIKFSATGAGNIAKNIILTGQDNHLITGALRMHNQSDNTLIAGYDNASMDIRGLLTNTESNKWSSLFTAQGISFKNSDSANAHVNLHKTNGLSFYNSSNTSKYFRIRRYQQGQINIEDTDTNENGAFNRAVILPSPDNTISFGGASLRWKNIYAGNGTIQTSDEREKQDIAPIEDAVFRAWGKVDFVTYRFRDSVVKKGDSARIHFGLIAQRVKEAFESEGLDAFKYGLLCYDEWEDEYEDIENENGTIEHRKVTEAGNRYGIRYDEALALECAYQRWLSRK